ncbi:MAG: hypothetical protein ACK4RZ_12005 [Paracoccaceae bacterium]
MRAWLGDPSSPSFEHDNDVKNAIIGAHTALRSGATKITALTGDMTRSEPERHHVGGQVSAQTVAALESAQATLKSRANAYEATAKEALRDRFAMKADDKWVYDRWAGFVEREAKNPDGGYANVSAAIGKHRDLAVVMMKLPPELLGVPSEQHVRWQTAAVEKWEPEIGDGFQMAQTIRDVADRYVRITAMVKLNFHSPVIASRMKTRVAI